MIDALIALQMAVPATPAPPSVASAAQFTAAYARAGGGSALDRLPPSTAVEYVRTHPLQAAALQPGVFDRISGYGQQMSQAFAASINEQFAKVATLDFTDPTSLITQMEVQLGFFGAATQVQFAAKVADFSVHGVTTLFRNQG